MTVLHVAGQEISNNAPAFVIAEAGVNHNGSVIIAKRLCNAAKKAGADAVKFQTWITRELLTETVSKADYQKRATGRTELQYEMLKKLELSFKDFREIANHCAKIGITFLSTPGDKQSADFLERLGVPAFKIGSDDADNLPLLKHVAEKKKPMLVSTGMLNMEEVREILSFLRKYNKKVAILHCTSSYPVQLRDVNLKAMVTLKKELEVLAGYSDHTTSVSLPALAVTMGARIIEKHLTLDRHMKGPDQRMSMDPDGFGSMMLVIRKTEKEIGTDLEPVRALRALRMILGGRAADQLEVTLGSPIKSPTKSEIKIMPAVKKTIVAIKNIKAGELFSDRNIAIMRAGYIVLRPREYFNLIGRKTKIDIKKDEIIGMNMLR